LASSKKWLFRTPACSTIESWLYALPVW
jgi:LytS/YehU family sensor histidine kinase